MDKIHVQGQDEAIRCASLPGELGWNRMLGRTSRSLVYTKLDSSVFLRSSREVNTPMRILSEAMVTRWICSGRVRFTDRVETVYNTVVGVGR